MKRQTTLSKLREECQMQFGIGGRILPVYGKTNEQYLLWDVLMFQAWLAEQ